MVVDVLILIISVYLIVSSQNLTNIYGARALLFQNKTIRKLEQGRSVWGCLKELTFLALTAPIWFFLPDPSVISDPRRMAKERPRIRLVRLVLGITLFLIFWNRI